VWGRVKKTSAKLARSAGIRQGVLDRIDISDKLRAKKAPLGERGIRVIVVVANPVSVSAYGLWWIVIIVFTALIIFVSSCSYRPF